MLGWSPSAFEFEEIAVVSTRSLGPAGFARRLTYRPAINRTHSHLVSRYLTTPDAPILPTGLPVVLRGPVDTEE